MNRPVKSSISFDWILQYAPVFISPILLYIRPLFRFESFYWGTPFLQFIPWRILAWEATRTGTLPLWNPLNGMGSPLLANYQLAFFYPPGWIVYVLAAIGGEPGLAWSHTLLIVFHLIWAGLGMVYLGEKIGLDPFARCISALAFSLSGYLVARVGFFSMIWTVSWLPWIIFAVSSFASPLRGIEKPVFRDWLRLVFFIGMQLLAGHAQLSFYTILLVLFWVFAGAIRARNTKSIFSIFLKLVVAIVAAALVAAVQLLPTAELLQNSQRAISVDYEAAASYSLWPWRLLGLFSPNLFGNPGNGNYWGYATFWEDSIYIGLLPILLVFLPGRRESPVNKDRLFLRYFLWGLGILSIILALGRNLPVFGFLYRNVPTFAMFQAPSRFLIWLVFALCLLAGIGSMYWQRPTGKSLYWTRLMTAGAFSISAGALLAKFLLPSIEQSFITPVMITGALLLFYCILSLSKPDDLQSRKDLIWKSAATIFLICDLVIAGAGLNPTLPSKFFSTTRPTEQIRAFFSTEDENSIKFRKFFRFSDYRFLDDYRLMKNMNLPNSNVFTGTHFINNFDPLLPKRYVDWIEEINHSSGPIQRQYLAMSGVDQIFGLDIKSRLGVSKESIAVSQRIRWTSCGMKAHTPEEAFELVRKEAVNRTSGAVYRVVLEGSSQNPSEICSSGVFHATIENETSISVRLATESEFDGWLVFADTWYPGWIAKLDGQKVNIYTADYVFRGVFLPKGFHSVEFIYKPVVFTLGLIITMLSLISLGIFCCYEKFVVSNQKNGYTTSGGA